MGRALFSDPRNSCAIGHHGLNQGCNRVTGRPFGAGNEKWTIFNRPFFNVYLLQ